MESKDYAHAAAEGGKAQRASIFYNFGKSVQVASNIAVNEKLTNTGVLVQVMSSSINPVDWKIRNGDMKLVMNAHFPKITGRDLSGKVIQVGPSVTEFKVGDEVYGMAEKLIGCHCEYVQCDSKSLALKPESLSFNEAAALPLVALSAQQGVIQLGGLKSGQSILILGGSSGVGQIGVQIAKAVGAIVYTTCGAHNADWVKALGADVVIDYKAEDFAKRVLELGKVDVVFDAVGQKPERDRSFDLVKPKGIVVTTTPNDDRNQMGVGEALRTVGEVIWKKMSNYVSSGIGYSPFLVADFQGNVLRDYINPLIKEGKLKPKIDSVWPLSEIQSAFNKSESGKLSGKIVIEISKP